LFHALYPTIFMNEIYVSTDIEANGPIPGSYSMLSFASAAYLADKTIVSTFTVNLIVLPTAKEDPETMEWWSQNSIAWEACRINCQEPSKAMHDYARWVRGLEGKPVFVAYPAAYDFMFIYWYLMEFVGSSPFGHNALDIRSFAMAALKTTYSSAGKKNLPNAWLDPLPHTHIALDDAIAQGALLCNMLKANV
jgi:hypothetical protein